MSAGQEASLELKRNIRDKLQQILDYSMKTNLSSTEHSVEDYIEMVNNRQTLIDELAALKPQSLKDLGESTAPPSGNLELDSEIKNIVEKIAAREKHHEKQAAGMMQDLKSGLKTLSAEKSINSLYLKDSYESGMILNTKN